MHFPSSPFGGALHKPLPILWPIAPVELFLLVHVDFYLCICLGIVENSASLACPYPCEERHSVWQWTAPVTKSRVLSDLDWSSSANGLWLVAFKDDILLHSLGGGGWHAQWVACHGRKPRAMPKPGTWLLISMSMGQCWDLQCGQFAAVQLWSSAILSTVEDNNDDLIWWDWLIPA